jgi:hypothetical protein
MEYKVCRSQTSPTPKGKAATPKKEAKAGKKAAKPARTKEASTPRAEEQGRDDPGADRSPEGRDPARDHESHGSEGPQRAGLPLDRRQEARSQDEVNET